MFAYLLAFLGDACFGSQAELAWSSTPDTKIDGIAPHQVGEAHAMGARLPKVRELLRRARPDQRLRKNAWWPRGVVLKKIKLLLFFGSRDCLCPSRLEQRGVARDRHDTRGGEAMAADCRSVLSGARTNGDVRT